MRRQTQLNVYNAKEPITRVRTVSLNLAHIVEEQISKENSFHKTRVRETQKKYALLVEEYKQAELYNMEEKGSEVWTVDSGCTGHMINVNEYLIDQKQYNSNIKTARKGNTIMTRYQLASLKEKIEF
jgi:hypothetical protein